MDEAQETQIVARILEGDRQAFALLVEEYKFPIYNLAYRMTGDMQDAADVTQDIFIRAYTYLWRYNPKKKFFTWLYTIALNTIKNHIKKNKKYKNLRSQDSEESKLLASQNLSETQDINIYLSHLDAETRALIIMRYVQELSFEEIAKITGKSISAVKMRTYRGLESLREKIK
ncbi:MAG TPA: sigma-70 family RNA polymerase sigma factor [Smithellaceae bacterium]|nr:sigma-70 family RNA polymerase sigma factor [Smithellaceae bacterium]HRT36499.1 sigma-70 family RNA polymerase sigma factor [Smithellaceae bacterium]HRU26813.1 sigma-70 family RNA polymerase sigma factor [Smithellaceae bacterium]